MAEILATPLVYYVTREKWALMVKEMERVQQAVRQLYIQQPWGGPPPDFYKGNIKERMEALRKNEGD